MPTVTYKPKQRLCCLMRPIGECLRCKKTVCTGHGRSNYEIDYMNRKRLTSIECRSPKCNDSTVKERLEVARRRAAIQEWRGITKTNVRGKALLDRISSQKGQQSISKISQRRKHK